MLMVYMDLFIIMSTTNEVIFITSKIRKKNLSSRWQCPQIKLRLGDLRSGIESLMIRIPSHSNLDSDLTIFDCCKQSLTRLYHPSILPSFHPSFHPSIHPSSKLFRTKYAQLTLRLFNSIFSTQNFERNFLPFSTPNSIKMKIFKMFWNNQNSIFFL